MVTCNAYSESVFVKGQVSTEVSRSFSKRGVSCLLSNAFIRLWETKLPIFLTRRLICIATFCGQNKALGCIEDKRRYSITSQNIKGASKQCLYFINYFFSKYFFFSPLRELWFHAFSGITFKINSILAVFPLPPSPVYPLCHKERQSPATFVWNVDAHVSGCRISQNKSLHSSGCQHLLLALS